MKIAVLSDIHGNFPALTAVTNHITRWQPDLTLLDGDIVGAGPCNADCWAFVQQQVGWHVLRGNHEDYVVEWADPTQPTSGTGFDLSRLSHWTYHQLQGDVAGLAALPDRFGWQAPDGSTLFATHASTLGNRAGIYPTTAVAEMRRKLSPYPAVFVTAHTHIPFIRQVDQTLLVNVGSVGLIGDGDQRASYAQLTWTRRAGWQAAIVRVAYDIAQTEQDFVRSGYLAEAGPGAALTLVELRTARDAKTRWTLAYRDAVLSGELSMAASVRAFLDTPEFRPYLAGIPLMA